MKEALDKKKIIIWINKHFTNCPCNKNEIFTISDYMNEFNLSEKIYHKNCYFPKFNINKPILDVEDVKEFIHQGDRIFTEDYANDEVTTEEYDYAFKKWEKFKKLAGDLK